MFDQKRIPAGDTGRLMGLALAPAVEPSQATAWIEGFLRRSGLILLHNEELRRPFSTFSAPERRQIGERLKRGSDTTVRRPARDAAIIDIERARKILPLAAQILGLDKPQEGTECTEQTE